MQKAFLPKEKKLVFDNQDRGSCFLTPFCTIVLPNLIALSIQQETPSIHVYNCFEKVVKVHATNPKGIVGSFRSHLFNLMIRIFEKSENDEALCI